MKPSEWISIIAVGIAIIEIMLSVLSLIGTLSFLLDTTLVIIALMRLKTLWNHKESFMLGLIPGILFHQYIPLHIIATMAVSGAISCELSARIPKNKEHGQLSASHILNSDSTLFNTLSTAKKRL